MAQPSRAWRCAGVSFCRTTKRSRTKHARAGVYIIQGERILCDVVWWLIGAAMSEGRTRKSSTRNQRTNKRQQAVATHAGAAVGLPPPGEALTPMPAALRSGFSVGAIRARRESGYVAREFGPPDVDQSAELPAESGCLRPSSATIVARLAALLVSVRRGDRIFDALADGELVSWHARMLLWRAQSAHGLNPDTDRHYTVTERVALVRAVLDALGAPKTQRRGGWQVSR